MGKSFRGPLICRLTGITYRKLDYWDRTGVVRPSIATANGSGSQRRYSYEDVVLVATVAALLDAGLSLDTARAGVEALRRHGRRAAFALVIGPTGAGIARTPDELTALHSGARVLTVVNLAAVRAALDEAIDGHSLVRLAG